MAQQAINLNPGESRIASFEVTPTVAKTYQVEVDGLTGSFAAVEEKPPTDTYTIGIYYTYLKADKGSTSLYRWRADWDSWCKAIVDMQTNLLVRYLRNQGIADADVRRIFVNEYASPVSYDFATWDFPKDIAKLPGYGTVDLHIAVASDYVYPGRGVCYRGYRTLLVNGALAEQQMKIMLGQYGSEAKFCWTLVHEIGHSFGLDHCSAGNYWCPMSEAPNVSYSEWVSMGKMLKFCDAHRNQLYTNWIGRVYS